MAERPDVALDAVSYLYALQKFGIKMGLETITSLLDSLGNPHRRYPVVHVAGTNGKGSTSAFIASMLQATGLRTGLYTSPHLVDFSERIRVDGTPISAQEIAEYTERIRPMIDPLRGTFFEATTAMAFQAFADRGVDIAVIETGLGGRLDSTNIVDPLLSVITSIDLDHTEYLGLTLESIASEKAGIIKPGRPVISGVLDAGAAAVLRARAEELRAPFHDIGTGTPHVELLDIDRMQFHALVCGSPRLVETPLVGPHQARNASLAIQAVEVLAGRLQRPILAESIMKGLEDVRWRTGVRCRLERIRTSPEIVCDVAHNPAGFRALFDVWERLRNPGATHLVFGLSKSKNVDAVLEEIGRHRWQSLTAAGFESPELYGTSDIVARGLHAGLVIGNGGDVSAAVNRLCGECESKESILLCGSHYIVGGFLAKEKLNMT